MSLLVIPHFPSVPFLSHLCTELFVKTHYKCTSLIICSNCVSGEVKLSPSGRQCLRYINAHSSIIVRTYSIAMPQCLPALSPAAWKPDRPIRATVGVMVRGPMYFNSTPGKPKAPTHTSTMEDTMIAPWIWEINWREEKYCWMKQDICRKGDKKGHNCQPHDTSSSHFK